MGITARRLFCMLYYERMYLPKRGFTRHAAGFTLIELLVVIAIIGILASIVLTALNGGRANGRDSKRISDIRQLKYSLELYYERYNQYPTCLSAHGVCTTTLAGSGFISAVPTDPSTGIAYTYAALGSGTGCGSYHVGVSLENKSSAVLLTDADQAAAGVCTGSDADFSGLSFTAGGVACSTSAGVKQPSQASNAENCYDVIPN